MCLISDHISHLFYFSADSPGANALSVVQALARLRLVVAQYDLITFQAGAAGRGRAI